MENSNSSNVTSRPRRVLKRALSALGNKALRQGLDGCPLTALATRGWAAARIRKRFDTRRVLLRMRRRATAIDNRKWDVVVYRSMNVWSASVLVDAFVSDDGAGGSSTLSLVVTESQVASIVGQSDDQRARLMARSLPARLCLNAAGQLSLADAPVSALEGDAAAPCKPATVTAAARRALRCGDHIANCPWWDGSVHRGVVVRVGACRAEHSFLDTEGNQSRAGEGVCLAAHDGDGRLGADVVHDDGAVSLAIPFGALALLPAAAVAERRARVDAASTQYAPFGFDADLVRRAVELVGIERGGDDALVIDMIARMEESVDGDVYRSWRDAPNEEGDGVEEEVWEAWPDEACAY